MIYVKTVSKIGPMKVHTRKKKKIILTILVSTLSLVGVALLILYEHCVATHFFESTDMLFAKCLNKRLRFLRKN